MYIQTCAFVTLPEDFENSDVDELIRLSDGQTSCFLVFMDTSERAEYPMDGPVGHWLYTHCSRAADMNVNILFVSLDC